MMRALLFFVVAWCCTAVAVAQPVYIPYVDGDKWGYMDSTGRILIAAKWTGSTDFFKNGRARVHTAGRLALIDTTGTYIIPPGRDWNGSTYTSVIGAFYNAKGKHGKYGIIDANNNELLPCLYDKTENGNGFTVSGYFVRDKYYNNYVAKVCKNGKFGVIDTLNRTIIPFAYDGIDIDHTYPFSSPRLFVVQRGGKMGLIDLYGRQMIPPVYRNVHLDEKNNNQVKLFKEKTTVIADTNGKILWEIPGYTLDFPRHGHIPVVNSEGKAGIMNYRRKLVIPCNYLGAWLNHDTIVVSRWLDSVHHNTQQFRYYDMHTYLPISGWLGYEAYAGIPPRSAPQPEAALHTGIPHVAMLYIDGQNVAEYRKGDMLWGAIDWPKQPEKWTPAQGIRGDDTTTKYAAIIDNYGDYVLPPYQTDNELRVLNAADSLVVIKTPGEEAYAVADFRMRQIMPFQPYPIVAAFYYRGTFYAVARHDRPHWVSWHSFEGGGSYEAHDYTYHLVTAGGQPVQALAGYKLHWLTDSSGYHADTHKNQMDRQDGFEGVFSGYMMAEDSTGRTGIVDVDGRVLLPAVSFQYRQMTRMGPDVLLVDNYVPPEPDRWSSSLWQDDYTLDPPAGKQPLRGLPYLVNSKNQVLLDSLTVESAGRITEPTPLYIIYLKRPEGSYTGNGTWFYMSDRGKGYYRKLPAWE